MNDEARHAVIDFSRGQDDVGQTGIVPNQKPGIDWNAVTAYTGARLEDIHAGMLVGDTDNLIHVHIVTAANFG